MGWVGAVAFGVLAALGTLVFLRADRPGFVLLWLLAIVGFIIFINETKEEKQ